ncbi:MULTISPECIES: hypothetical protein [unclassified Solwaraspora]|uniref:hypothetical protein n=1 Tax=unclassified Solwaraspora TaxID=2627926 RepID=UPI00248AEF76|nr:MULTISPECIES: hypothetical protein [unclassified Solwaraspora]WBB98788.1 hypothetical protein O7553_07835 [Solwaraspora sp. WMMA2059]WBC22659.1 hypothetical protein O7543_09530 [Solwaraspora sp. WMMA2080]WJK35292.1 hypothetical protein O7610_02585 [Solwaraspora sp. WMMA2065]
MLFSGACPVRETERDWIDESLSWLIREFGEPALRGPVVLPTDEFFPGAYHGSRADVAAVLHRVARHMAVDPDRVELVFEPADDTEAALLASLPAYAQAASGAAGHYVRRGGRGVITIAGAQARQPMALVATIAHELAHERLIGEGRHRPDAADHEPLTDLTTVFFGLGIFTANAAFDYRGRAGGWQSSRLGYLTEPMYGYALGRYAWLRDDLPPRWARQLDTNPRSYLRRSLRYLDRRR